MRWGGLIDFSTAALPHAGDTNVGGQGLTTSDVTNVTDLAWAGENEYAGFGNIGSGSDGSGGAIPLGTVSGRGSAVSPIKYSGQGDPGQMGGPGSIVNPGAIDSPLGDPIVWTFGVVGATVLALYLTRKEEEHKEHGVITDIAVTGVKSFAFLLIIKLFFERFKVAGLSEIIEFAA